VTGFTQMAIAAAAAQGCGHLLAHASGPIPMMVQMLFFGVATAAAFLLLVRR
jgi:hypothetical protein